MPFPVSSTLFRNAIHALIIASLLFIAGKVFSIDWLGRSGWWSTWISMSVFIFFSGSLRPTAAFFAAFFFGWVAMISSFFWAEQMLAYSLNQEGWVPRLVFWTLIFVESIPIGVLGCLISWSRRKYPSATGLCVPFAFWILAESWWPRVFPWTLGHSQQGWPDLVQIADLGGGSLISWLVLWGASIPLLLFDCVNKSKDPSRRFFASRRAICIACIAIICSVGYGRYSINYWSNHSKLVQAYSIAAIQEDPSYVDSIQKMRIATGNLEDRYDLICWPESTLGTLSTDVVTFADADSLRRGSLPPAVDISPIMGLSKPLIVGGRSFDGLPRENVPQHQTAFVIDTNGSVLAHYHKRCLMPLGEYVPGEYRWPWLHDWFQLNEFIIAGTSVAPVRMPDQTQVGILICFEDIIAEVVRSTVASGAQVLVCIINDSAFENPVALEQHMHLARLRTIENRRFLVRVAGTGVSCVISPTGEITHSIDAMVSSAFVAKTQLIHVLTWYTRLGNWVPWAAIFSMVVAVASNFKRATD